MTQVTYSRKQVTLALKEAVGNYFLRYRYAVHYEVGVKAWGRRRADIVANKISGRICIIEVKSSRADYTTDSKWLNYLDHCDLFYLCFHDSVWPKIDKTDIPKQVGVLILSSVTGYVRVVKPAKNLNLSDEARLLILARLAWRSGDLSKRTQRARNRVFVKE